MIGLEEIKAAVPQLDGKIDLPGLADCQGRKAAEQVPQGDGHSKQPPTPGLVKIGEVRMMGYRQSAIRKLKVGGPTFSGRRPIADSQ